MKIGYCVNMLDASGGCGFDWIRTVKHSGFDYVELPLAQIMTLGDKAFRSLILSALETSNIPCTCCNNFFPGCYRLTGSEADHESALAYAAAAMARASTMGASKIVFGSSGARNMPAGFPKEKAMEQLSCLLRSLSEMADSLGLELVLEPLNRMESNLLNSLAECNNLSRTLALSNIKVLADTFHMSLSNESPEHLLDVGEHLRHVHLARTLNRSLPMEGDGEPWAQWTAYLRQIGYNDTLSIEAYAPLPDRQEALSTALSFIRFLL